MRTGLGFGEPPVVVLDVVMVEVEVAVLDIILLVVELEVELEDVLVDVVEAVLVEVELFELIKVDVLVGVVFVRGGGGTSVPVPLISPSYALKL
jgi:hypothetical protein